MAGLDSWLASPPSRDTQEEGRFLLGILKGHGLTFNDNVSPGLAAHSWDYLAFLWLYAGMAILGALVPLYKYIPEEELLYPDYDFDAAGKKEPAMKENPSTTTTEMYQSYYDYDAGYDYNNEMSSQGNVMPTNQNNNYHSYQSGGQDDSETSTMRSTQSYPPPSYYNVIHYPPPRY